MRAERDDAGTSSEMVSVGPLDPGFGAGRTKECFMVFDARRISASVTGGFGEPVSSYRQPMGSCGLPTDETRFSRLIAVVLRTLTDGEDG